MNITEFDYYLPDDLIAQQPLESRDSSRMLAVDRNTCTFTDSVFNDLPSFLRRGDVLVLNNTRVFPARLLGKTETGAGIEIFLIRELDESLWESLARPARRLKPGKKIVFDNRLTAEVIEVRSGKVSVRFTAIGDLHQMLDEIGRTPLPPYIKRQKASIDTDRDRYQTVYATHRGAIAAPTAGLHFTPEIIDDIKKIGVTIAEITLHVGYGTFESIRVDDLSGHTVSPETYKIDAETEMVLNSARTSGSRIVAVGTTTTRALEDAVSKHGGFVAGEHAAELTITPGYDFRAINALLTNFHLPQSSLLVLTSVFGGHKLIMKAYRYAISKGYRFYSYGDCMFII